MLLRFYRPLSGPKGSGANAKVGTKERDIKAEEDSAKREAMKNAAVQRSQAWDRKLSKASSQRSAASSSDNLSSMDEGSNVNEETARAVQKVKEGEAKTEQVIIHILRIVTLYITCFMYL